MRQHARKLHSASFLILPAPMPRSRHVEACCCLVSLFLIIDLLYAASKKKKKEKRHTKDKKSLQIIGID